MCEQDSDIQEISTPEDFLMFPESGIAPAYAQVSDICITSLCILIQLYIYTVPKLWQYLHAICFMHPLSTRSMHTQFHSPWMNGGTKLRMSLPRHWTTWKHSGQISFIARTSYYYIHSFFVVLKSTSTLSVTIYFVHGF
jgi:hypothetical protein